MTPEAFIDCGDYGVGDFIPLSFEPKLNWKITESKFVEHPTDKLPRSIIIEAKCFNGIFIVASHSYSCGRFHMEHRQLGVQTRRLETNDPEEAIYLAELFLRKRAENLTNFYRKIVESL